MDFRDKVVVITGASSGIGASAAFLFAKQAAKLALVGRNIDNLLSVAARCETVNAVKPLIVKAELANDDDVKQIVEKTVKEYGRIDVLVNNAGIGVCGSILDGVQLYDKAMSTNMRAVYLLSSVAAPHIIKSKGNIINISSVAAFKPIKDADYLPYCISKAALDQFTKCLALEMAQYGVRVNSVNPGGTKTPFAENAGFSKAESEALYKAREEKYPLGKMADSDEVAELIVFLASDKAKSITGSIYVIDNGEMLM